MKSYITKFCIAATVISSAFLTSCKNENYSRFEEMETPVNVKEVSKKSISELITTTGTAYAWKASELMSETAGKYRLMKNPKTGRTFKMGDIVEKGTVIIKLEDKEYENGIQLRSKELTLDLAKKEWEAQKVLYEKGGVTLKELTNAESSYINAEYALENANINLDKLKIKAPFRGIIVDLPYFTEGNKIKSGEKLVQIMDYSKMYMEVKFSEKNIESIKTGQAANITNYTIKEDTINGKITQISPAVNPETRAFGGYMEIYNPDYKLRPGMFVKADIVTQRKDNVIVVPKDAIVNYPDKKTVYIVERNRAVECTVITGLESDNEIEIVKGIEEKQRLIINNQEMLHDQARVKVLK